MPDTVGLFNKIARHYDLLNTIFSLGLDRYWRLELVKEIQASRATLDIATGTAEVPVRICKELQNTLVIGLDPSINMLKIAVSKTRDLPAQLVQGENESLPFPANTFDAVTIAYGIRNTRDLELSLEEIIRVLKQGGKLAILEFTTPENFVFRPLFLFYFRHVMPFISSFFSSRKEYSYLSESAGIFPQREKFTELLIRSGYSRVSYRQLFTGISAIYIAYKP